MVDDTDDFRRMAKSGLNAIFGVFILMIILRGIDKSRLIAGQGN